MGCFGVRRETRGSSLRRVVGRVFVGLAVVVVVLLPGAAAGAAALPSGFTETQVASGLVSPTAMALAPDGRLFVAEQTGRLRVIKNGTLLSAPFLTVTVSSSGERGLLGVALDPAFATNGYVYVYYTATTATIHNRVSRFTASGDVAVAGSEVIILELNPLSAATNHNGGALHFGPDGKLYVAAGDNANGANAQSFDNLLGKILRINADGSIPSDNPFFATTSGQNRAIWALGLRNPFTFSFRPRTGRMFINDVGELTWEEINDGIAGSNYGWPATEGPTTDTRVRSPIHWYGHGTGATTGCAITGGAFYDPPTTQFPTEYVGEYFFADFCSGWIRKLDPASGNSVAGFATGISNPVDLAVSADGSLYYLARGSGSVHRIHYTGSQAPSITAQPANQTVTVGQAATFRVSATGTEPLSHQWQRNGADIPGATSATYTLSSAQTSDSGARFRVRVTNAFGTVTSNEAVLTVTTNAAPTATIAQPAAGTLYRAGDTIAYSGSGTDPEDGALSASAFTWRVDFHHDTHVHPFMAPTSGSTSGSFRVPTTGETSPNVWYRIVLTVTDSGGLSHTTFRDVRPRTASVRLETSPSGLGLTLDGQPVTAPFSFTGVVGMERTLEALSPQTAVGATWEFDSWSDGGARLHTISTPATSSTYSAVYRVSGGSIGTGAGLSATYHDGLGFTGRAVTRADATVNFAWATGEPVAGLGADTFSVRWTGQVQPQFSGTYTFYTQSDDGVRLWVNGRQLVDNWTDHALTENSGAIALTAGVKYDLRMEYYENAGHAAAKLLWSGPSTPKSVIPKSQLYVVGDGQGLSGTYYDRADLTGTTAVVRLDPTVNFAWATGEPVAGLGADTFSVRWTGQVQPQFSGTYTFYTQSDDGVRLWVNGRQLVNNWTDHALTENSGAITLTAGVKYDVRMEFYENAGHAAAKLLWSGPSTAKSAVPRTQLYLPQA